MWPAGVKKCGGDEPVEFFACEDGFGIEDIFLLECEALEALPGYPNGQCDNHVSADWRGAEHLDL